VFSNTRRAAAPGTLAGRALLAKRNVLSGSHAADPRPWPFVLDYPAPAGAIQDSNALAIARVAERQHNLIHLTQLQALGLSADAVRKRAAEGRPHRIYHGV
jgi:hypothetical protein